MTNVPGTLRRVEQGLRMITVPFPHLAGLVGAARVSLDARVPTVGVFASGRLAVNPAFVDGLKDGELTFVLAHEMLHLALRTHDRARGADRLEFNVAHDYIINDMLRAELGVPTIPANGLDMPGARHRTAEEIVLEMRRKRSPDAPRPEPWRIGEHASAGGDPDASHEGDVLADELERDWYPEDPAAQEAAIARIKALSAKALALSQAMGAMRGGRGESDGSRQHDVEALRGLYRTPWQLALQRWMESVAPGERTFMRASRRRAVQPDVVLPGRRRQGWLLNVVLDTSASMSDDIARALGAIADFCDAAGVDQVRLVQCDAAVTSDDCVEPAALARHAISGYGGSDLTPALMRLADDPGTQAAVVITDGDIAYPQQPLPFDVLWVLPSFASSAFSPPYGRVVTMQ